MLNRTATGVLVAILLAVFLLQLLASVHGESQTWDEQDHIYAGYMAWKTHDHGLNPEHPPLVKMWSVLPLLGMELKVPALRGDFFKNDAFLGGQDFLYKNDAIKMLWKTRVNAALFSVLMAMFVLLAATEMFGNTAGIVALALVVFEPNLLAHGALVTTDMGLSCFTLGSVYLFYRFAQRPTAMRLASVGVVFGLALSSKHSAILVFGMLVALAAIELGWQSREGFTGQKIGAPKMMGAVTAMTLIAVAVLWSVYGFRYAARPSGLTLNPPFGDYLEGLKPFDHWAISTAARFHLLPESYLYGLADVRKLADFMPTYIFGKVYAHGVWYYFPTTFVIKSTLAFMALLLVTAAAMAMGTFRKWREILFLVTPCAIYLAVAMTTGLNIGARHVLPLWPLLAVLIGGGAAALMERDRRWIYAVCLLLAAHVATSARSYPHYIAYSNEIVGGPANTYKYLSDSNTDWAQQLHTARRYLESRGVKQCWFAYFAAGAVDTHYYGIPCRMLPTADTMWFNMETTVPDKVEGPVLISAGTINGFELGSSQLNPYEEFRSRTPVAFLDYGIFVFDGNFDMHRAAAMSHWQKANNRADAKKLDEALVEAQAAVASDAEAPDAQGALGRVLRELGRVEESRSAFQKAIEVSKRLEEPKRSEFVGRFERELASLENPK